MKTAPHMVSLPCERRGSAAAASRVVVPAWVWCSFMLSGASMLLLVLCVHQPEHSIDYAKWHAMRETCEWSRFSPDIFVLQHAYIWAVAAVGIRHPIAAYCFSFWDEIAEQVFSEKISNLRECWWDTLLLDLLGANLLGVLFGWLCLHLTGIKWYHYPVNRNSAVSYLTFGLARMLMMVNDFFVGYTLFYNVPLSMKLCGYGWHFVRSYLLIHLCSQEIALGFNRWEPIVPMILQSMVDSVCLRPWHARLHVTSLMDFLLSGLIVAFCVKVHLHPHSRQ